MKDKVQKSNKMKRQEIKAKKERALVLEKKAHKPQPKVYVLNKKVRNLTSAIEDVFKGAKFPYSESKIKNIEEAVGKAGYDNRDFLKRTFLHFADLNIDFAEKRTANHQNRGTDPIDVLVNLAKCKAYAIRNIEDWKPNSYNINNGLSFTNSILHTIHALNMI